MGALNSLASLASRLRNVAVKVRLKKREGWETQVETQFGRVYQLEEMQPHGLAAKASEGRGLCVFIGGNTQSPVLLPLAGEKGRPELEDGEVAVFNEGGGGVLLKQDATIEINGADYGGTIGRRLKGFCDLWGFCRVCFSLQTQTSPVIKLMIRLRPIPVPIKAKSSALLIARGSPYIKCPDSLPRNANKNIPTQG